jgi:hypothetical protein
MVALAASGAHWVGRKLLMICYGMLKHQKFFDAKWPLQFAAET